MPFTMTCPECDAQMAVPDAIAGKTIRCKACGETFKANPPATKSGPSARPRDDDEPRRSRPQDDEDDRPRRRQDEDDDQPRRRDNAERSRSGRRRPAGDDETGRPGRARRGRLPLVLGLFVLLAGGGVAAYLIFFRSWPTDYTDPDGMYTARFPDTPEYKIIGDPGKKSEWVAAAKAGGLEYSVTVDRSPASGPPIPETRDRHVKMWASISAQSTGGELINEEPVDHKGQRGLDVIVRYQSQGRAMFVRLLATDKHVLRMTVAGPAAEGDQAKVLRERALAFFETVQITPALGNSLDREPDPVPAAEIGAAYQRDPRAADARYKNQWVKAVGMIREVSADGKEASMEAGGQVIRLKGDLAGLKPGETAIVTGYGQGLLALNPGPPSVHIWNCSVRPNPKG